MRSLLFGRSCGWRSSYLLPATLVALCKNALEMLTERQQRLYLFVALSYNGQRSEVVGGESEQIRCRPTLHMATWERSALDIQGDRRWRRRPPGHPGVKNSARVILEK